MQCRHLIDGCHWQCNLISGYHLVSFYRNPVWYLVTHSYFCTQNEVKQWLLQLCPIVLALYYVWLLYKLLLVVLKY